MNLVSIVLSPETEDNYDKIHFNLGSGMELKNCPFCNSEAEFSQSNDHHGEFFYLGCSNKECPAWELFYTIPNEDMKPREAAEIWNTRY